MSKLKNLWRKHELTILVVALVLAIITFTLI